MPPPAGRSVVNLKSRSRPNIELLLVGRQAPDLHHCR
jgi:hypothetical protein